MSRDYSATPLSQKLGAKPGADVTILFTTSRDELERRFPKLRDTLADADGLWVAWPRDNKSCSIDERWQALRFVHRLKDRG